MMDARLYNLITEDLDPDTFKSELSHKYCFDGEVTFLKDILTYDLIGVLYNKNWHFKALYTLSLLDYISQKRGAPLYQKYNDLRTRKLERPAFSSDVIISHTEKEAIQECAQSESGRIFMSHNIVEVVDYVE